jgi:hypothetical protein
MFIALAAMSLTIANVSYAEKYLDHVGGKGIDGADNQEKTEDEIGGRGANVGFVTGKQHGLINGYIARLLDMRQGDNAVYRSMDRYDLLASLDKSSPADTALMAGIVKYDLNAYFLPELSKETGVLGHYGIRGGNVYIDQDIYNEEKHTNETLLKHELYELIEILNWGKDRGTLVAWLNNPMNAGEATVLLQGFHDNNPYKLSKKDGRIVMHMPMPGVRGAAGGAEISNVVEVSNDSAIVLTKNNFFETNTDDSKIITVTADAIISGQIDVNDINKLINEENVSVAILVGNNGQVDGVSKIFTEANLPINDLLNKTHIVFVSVGSNILDAVNQMFKDNQRLLINNTLSNLNAKYGVQV